MATFRAWTAQDVEQLAATERVCFSDPWSQEMLQTEISYTAACGVIAEENGRMIGFAYGKVYFDEGELYKIGILPAFRGKGAGKALYKAWEDTIKSRGARKVFLEVRVSNQSALGLYNSRGFEKTRIRKRYYPDGEDALEMKLDLCPTD